MKRLVWPLLLLMGGTPGLAQKAFIYNMLQKNGFVSAAFGVSQPTGTFARPDGDGRWGRALRGSLVNLSAGYRLAGPLGLMARYEQTTNRVDPPPSANPYVQTNTGPTSAVAERWQTRSLMVGPFVTIPAGRLGFDVRALAGQIWALGPVSWPENQPGPASSWTENQTARAIAAGVGLTARYRLTPAMAVHLNSDYNAATFTFRSVPAESSTGSRARQITVDSQQTLSVVTVSVGATVQFRAKNYVF